VPDCKVGGYRGQVCSDVETAIELISPVAIPELCLRCIELSVCTRPNATAPCGWVGPSSYQQCLIDCRLPKPEPFPCRDRSPCGCLSESSCGWCQVTAVTTSSAVISGVTSPFSFGICLPISIGGKCSGSLGSGSYSGTFVQTKPVVCESPDVSNLNDESGEVDNSVVKDILWNINNGITNETVLQQLIDADNSLNAISLVIRRILQATVNGNLATVRTLVDVLSNTTLTQQDLVILCSRINNAISNALNVDSSTFLNCRLDLITSGSKKRQATSTQYVQSSDLQTAMPSSGTRSALCFVSLVLFCLFQLL